MNYDSKRSFLPINDCFNHSMEKEHVPDRKGLAYFFWALEMKYNLSTGKHLVFFLNT